MAHSMSTVNIYYRNDNHKAVFWAKKIRSWLKRNFPKIKLEEGKAPDGLIVLGGDGTVLAASQMHNKKRPVILGLNLGHIGFLASAREPQKFFLALRKFFKGDFLIALRMMVEAEIWRGGKKIYFTNSLNEISVQSLLGMVEIEVSIEGNVVQYIWGTGVLVATSTGSTAYNLSAHGPIVMPDIKCMILTELMDHNIPTPSIIIKKDREVELKILDFRKRKIFKLARSNEYADVVLTADGEKVFPLEVGDIIKIRRSPGLIKFAELEKGYFFKSLHEKFAFK